MILSEDALSVDISMELEDGLQEKKKKRKKKTKKAQAAADVTNLDESQEQLVDQYNDLEEYEMEPGARKTQACLPIFSSYNCVKQEMDEHSEDALSVDKMSNRR